MTVAGLTIVGTACYGQAQKRSHLTITPGVDFASMRAHDTNGTQVVFPDGTNLRLGAQFEFPLWSGNWSMILEPTYQRYTANTPHLLRYRSLEAPVGIRRYFNANNRTRFYINGAIVGDIPFRHTMELSGLNFEATGLKANFAAGIGVAVRRFTVEYRHYSRRTRRDNTGSFTYNYDKRSVIVGFRLY